VSKPAYGYYFHITSSNLAASAGNECLWGVVCGLGCVQVEQATRSTNKSLQRLVNLKGLKPEDIYATLCKQTVGLVFTAHPTQVQGWEGSVEAGQGAAVGTSFLRVAPTTDVWSITCAWLAPSQTLLCLMWTYARARICPPPPPPSSPHAGHAPVLAEEVRRDPACHGPPAQHSA
jgi:hypothetical protein